MTAEALNVSSINIWRGWEEEAVYKDQVIPAYRDNPLCESLILEPNEDELIDLLTYDPEYDDGQRMAATEHRVHLIENAMDFFQPLSFHLDLWRRISCSLRTGYKARNPVLPGFSLQTNKRLEGLQLGRAYRARFLSPAKGFTMIGISGIGKSSSLLMCLSLIPQVIHHNCYKRQNFTETQITWLKLDCPHDGSPRGLCLQFFWTVDSLIGTNYYKEHLKGHPTVDELLLAMSRVAANHHLGVLVIDEIQFLCEANVGGSDKMLNFFVQLTNTIKVPVILVGTYKAQAILSGKLRQARRGAGQGDFVWDRMKEDDDWEIFVKSLWRFQFVRTPSPLTEELSHTLYDLTQGITDFAVKAYMLAQWRSITRGDEDLNENHLTSVVRDCFRLARPMLDALRTGTLEEPYDFEDVFPEDFDALLNIAKNGSDDGISIEQQVEEVGEQAPRNTKRREPKRRKAASPSSKRPNKQSRSSSARLKTGKRSNIRAQQIALAEDDLRNILSSASVKGISPYEALKQSGNIRPAIEYLSTEGDS